MTNQRTAGVGSLLHSFDTSKDRHLTVEKKGSLMASSSSGKEASTADGEGENIGLAINTAYGSKNVTELNCIDIFDRLWYCGTPTNQLNAFYKVFRTYKFMLFPRNSTTCLSPRTSHVLDTKTFYAFRLEILNIVGHI